jgi:pimeloyl-ACP methyl ester carboxylesterase
VLAQVQPTPAVQTQVQTSAAAKGRTYVLVHGAWFGAWVWKDVAARLRAAGNMVYAPSLTGLGDRRHLLRPGINLDTHADDIVNLIVDEDLRGVVLVGWSYGGMVITDALARAPDRIASMVYLDAFFPEPGHSVASHIADGEYLRNLAEMVGNGQNIPALPMEKVGITAPEMMKLAASRVSPQPIGTFLQPSKALARRPGHVAYTFILAGRFDSALFRSIHERFREEGIGDAVALDSSHATMLTAPDETAELLRNVC